MCTLLRGESSGIPMKEASELSSQKSLLGYSPWAVLGSSIQVSTTAPLSLRCTFPHHRGLGHREAVLRQ